MSKMSPCSLTFVWTTNQMFLSEKWHLLPNFNRLWEKMSATKRSIHCLYRHSDFTDIFGKTSNPDRIFCSTRNIISSRQSQRARLYKCDYFVPSCSAPSEECAQVSLEPVALNPLSSFAFKIKVAEWKRNKFRLPASKSSLCSNVQPNRKDLETWSDQKWPVELVGGGWKKCSWC